MGEDKFSIYRMLDKLGSHCAQSLDKEDGQAILEMVNRSYQEKNLLVCNAIESEFVFSMASHLGLDNLIDTLNFMPDNLKLIYIKIILETPNNL